METRAGGHGGGLQLLDDRLGGWRRGRAVEHAVAGDMAGRVQLAETALQRFEVVELSEVDLHVEAGAQECIQHPLVDWLRARELRDLFRRVLAKRVVGQVVDLRAHHAEAGREQALLGEVVERGQQLAPAEVAGRAEDDHQARFAHAVVVEPLGERVGGDHAHLWAASPFASVTTAWPPNWVRIIASMRSATVCSITLRNRAKRDSAMIGTGTDSSIAASTVQRPSPVSSTQPLIVESSGSCSSPRAIRSSSHDRTTLPVRQASAIACMFMPGNDFDSFMTWNPSA